MVLMSIGGRYSLDLPQDTPVPPITISTHATMNIRTRATSAASGKPALTGCTGRVTSPPMYRSSALPALSACKRRPMSSRRK
jgi:hypothetical protein